MHYVLEVSPLSVLICRALVLFFLALCYLPSPLQAQTITVPCLPDLHLRAQALVQAVTTANQYAGHDTIHLTPGCTYTLIELNNTPENDSANGLPVIINPLTLLGHGATIERSTAPSSPDFRVLSIANTSGVLLQGVTIANGRAIGRRATWDTGMGGGIAVVQSEVELRANTIRDNIAVGSSTASRYEPNAIGGGIASVESKVRIVDSTITANQSTGGSETTNYAPGYGLGGGIVIDGGTVTIINSTISGNRTSVGSGRREASSAIGGGIFVSRGNVTIISTTLTDNHAEGGPSNTDAFAGGVSGGQGTVSVTNSIIIGNTSTTGLPDCDTIISVGYNLFGSLSDCGGRALDTTVASADSVLGPLQDNGGSTITHAVLANSPAIDAGDDAKCQPVDQRGTARPQDGNGDGRAECDIGAYEYLPAPTTTPTTTPTMSSPTSTTPPTPTSTPTASTLPSPTPPGEKTLAQSFLPMVVQNSTK